MRKNSRLALYKKSFVYLGPAKGKYVAGLLLGGLVGWLTSIWPAAVGAGLVMFLLALLGSALPLRRRQEAWDRDQEELLRQHKESLDEYAILYVNQALIDLVTGARQGSLMLTLLGMLALFVLLVPPVIAGSYLQTTAAEFGTVQLYKSMFYHINHMPYQSLTKIKTGDYLTRLRGDANRAVRNAFASFSVTNLIRFGVVFPVTLIMLLVNDWRIALAGVLYGGVNLLLSLWLNPLAKRQEAVAKEEIANSASFLIEALRAIPVVRVFVLHQVMAQRYDRMCRIIKEKRMKYQNIIGVTYGVVDFFAQSAQAVGFIIGILLGSGELSLGRAVFNATLMGMMGDSIYRLSTYLLLSQPTLVSMERVHSLLEQPLEDLEKGGTVEDAGGDMAVEFCSVGLDLTLRRGSIWRLWAAPAGASPRSSG